MSDDTNRILEILEEFRQGFSEMKTDIREMQEGLADTRREVRSLRTTIENVTNQNIQIISEQILNLENKLDRVSNDRVEIEILKLKLNRIEDEVRTLKDKKDSTALA